MAAIDNVVNGIIQQIVVQETGEYLQLIDSTNENEITDDRWRQAYDLYHGLDTENRGRFETLVRLVTIDTISSLLGLIDGVSSFEGQTDEFELTYADDVISGDLQDTFLARIEDLGT